MVQATGDRLSEVAKEGKGIVSRTYMPLGGGKSQNISFLGKMNYNLLDVLLCKYGHVEVESLYTPPPKQHENKD